MERLFVRTLFPKSSGACRASCRLEIVTQILGHSNVVHGNVISTGMQWLIQPRDYLLLLHILDSNISRAGFLVAIHRLFPRLQIRIQVTQESSLPRTNFAVGHPSHRCVSRPPSYEPPSKRIKHSERINPWPWDDYQSYSALQSLEQVF